MSKLGKLFNEYFRSITQEVPATLDGKQIFSDSGQQIRTIKFFKKPTISGMCVFAGISRHEFNRLEQEGDESIKEDIKKAKTVIESYLEERLFEGNVIGIIFMLKNNFGWRDKTEIDTNNKESIKQIEIVVSDKSDQARLEKLENAIRNR